VEVSDKLHVPAALPQDVIGGWVGPRAGLVAVEKGKKSQWYFYMFMLRYCYSNGEVGMWKEAVIAILGKDSTWNSLNTKQQ